MKSIILITLILTIIICSQTTFGQTKVENKKGTQGLATGGYKPNRQETPPNNNAINYESRHYQNDCYKNFAFTVKNYGYNKDGNFYSWGVVVKNNYSKAVQLKYKLIVGNNNSHIGTLTYYIKPGETYSNDFGTAKAIIVNNNSDQYKIEVSDVCFEGDDCVKNGYSGCNGKQSANEAKPTSVKGITSTTQSDQYYTDAKKSLQEGDNAKYQELLEKSAELGNVEAIVDISTYYRGSYNQPRDVTKADFYLLKAIELGNARAMHNYGYLLRVGAPFGVTKDYGKSLSWYLKSAEKGYLMANVEVGYIYKYGLGVEKNLETAKTWFKKACDLGVERGCTYLVGK